MFAIRLIDFYEYSSSTLTILPEAISVFLMLCKHYVTTDIWFRDLTQNIFVHFNGFFFFSSLFCRPQKWDCIFIFILSVSEMRLQISWTMVVDCMPNLVIMKNLNVKKDRNLSTVHVHIYLLNYYLLNFVCPTAVLLTNVLSFCSFHSMQMHYTVNQN